MLKKNFRQIWFHDNADNKGFYYEDGLKTVSFAKYLERQNIKFAYIMCPSKFSKDNNDLPIGLKDYSNENVDSFLKPLYENNIKVLDFRDLLIKEYACHFDAFIRQTIIGNQKLVFGQLKRYWISLTII